MAFTGDAGVLPDVSVHRLVDHGHADRSAHAARAADRQAAHDEVGLGFIARLNQHAALGAHRGAVADVSACGQVQHMHIGRHAHADRIASASGQ